MVNVEVKIKLYKFIDMGDQDTRYDIFDAVKIINEQGLREIFYGMVKNKIIPQKEIDDYSNQQPIDEFTDTEIMVDMINDITNYDISKYYIVREINL